jgi:hypothetical protein
MWLMSAFTPAVLTTSYRLSVWMRGDSFSKSDSGWPMPPPAPAGARLAQQSQDMVPFAGAQAAQRRAHGAVGSAPTTQTLMVLGACAPPVGCRDRCAAACEAASAGAQHAATRRHAARARARANARAPVATQRPAPAARTACAACAAPSRRAPPWRRVPRVRCLSALRRGAAQGMWLVARGGGAREKAMDNSRLHHTHTHAPCAHAQQRTALRLIRTNPPAGAWRST